MSMEYDKCLNIKMQSSFIYVSIFHINKDRTMVKIKKTKQKITDISKILHIRLRNNHYKSIT